MPCGYWRWCTRRGCGRRGGNELCPMVIRGRRRESRIDIGHTDHRHQFSWAVMQTCNRDLFPFIRLPVFATITERRRFPRRPFSSRFC